MSAIRQCFLVPNTGEDVKEKNYPDTPNSYVGRETFPTNNIIIALFVSPPHTTMNNNNTTDGTDDPAAVRTDSAASGPSTMNNNITDPAAGMTNATANDSNMAYCCIINDRKYPCQNCKTPSDGIPVTAIKHIREGVCKVHLLCKECRRTGIEVKGLYVCTGPCTSVRQNKPGRIYDNQSHKDLCLKSVNEVSANINEEVGLTDTINKNINSHDSLSEKGGEEVFDEENVESPSNGRWDIEGVDENKIEWGGWA